MANNDTDETIAYKISRSIAIREYQLLNDSTKLIQLGIDPKSVKRSPGRPRKHLHPNERVVQLIFKQKWQAGLPFSNAGGDDKNQCFAKVGENLGKNVRDIRESYYRVPEARRKEIEKWVFKILEEHSLLASNKKSKNPA
jgi:hypothetical protein